MNSFPKVSIIIPAFEFPESTKDLFAALSKQTKVPDELIVIDSSISSDISQIVSEFKGCLNIKYFKVNHAFPAEARNMGVDKATNEFIGFLDSKTIPSPSWLEVHVNQIIYNNFQVAFGSTQYVSKTKFQFFLQGCIYGKNPVETTPGSVLTKETMNKIGYFQEGVRASDDLDWRNRVRKHKLSFCTSSEGHLTYSELSKDFLSEIKRNFTYQFHSAFTEVQMNTKIFIFSISLLMISLIIPHWNGIVGWEGSLFYVPHITRGFFYVFSIFSIVLLTSARFLHARNILSKIFTIVFIFFFFYVATQWNQVIAKWADDSFLYIPHITKIYILSIVFAAFAFRAIYKPFNGGLSNQEIFPFNWIGFGAIGFILDLAKIPGYFFGALYALARSLKRGFT